MKTVLHNAMNVASLWPSSSAVFCSTGQVSIVEAYNKTVHDLLREKDKPGSALFRQHGSPNDLMPAIH